MSIARTLTPEHVAHPPSLERIANSPVMQPVIHPSMKCGVAKHGMILFESSLVWYVVVQSGAV